MSTPGPTAGRSSTNAPRNRSLVRALRRRRQLRAGLVQLLYVAVGVALGVLMPRVNWVPRVDADQVTAVFAGIGGGLIALVSVVYALLFLVVQFGATTHSPRLNLFRDSPLVWHAFGVFLGSFAYVSSVALGTAAGATVSILVPILGLLSVLASLAIARRLQLSALRSVQLAPILQDLADRGRAVLDQLYPEPFAEALPSSLAEPDHPVGVVWPWPPAVLRQIDLPPLLAVAERLDAEVFLTVGVGDTLWQDQVVIQVSTAPSAEEEEELLTGIEAGIERSFAQDPLLVFRLLNDIGLRALSPANSDPYTAIQVLDTIEGLLRRLTTRHLDVSVVPGGDGRSRVRLSLPDWEKFLVAAVDELLDGGRDLPTVRRRLLTLLNNLIALSPPPRLPALQRRRGQLTDT
jgi:uncharacterized membrane protein